MTSFLLRCVDSGPDAGRRNLPRRLFILWLALTTTGTLICGGVASQVENSVDVGSHRLYYELRGWGKPPVVVDVGGGESFESWSSVVAELSKTTSVLVYDRAGYGRSGMGPLPRDAGAEAGDLHTLLRNADIKGPYVVVGHSLGGLNMQVFAREYPTDVAGLVLLDPPPRGWLAGETFDGLKRIFLGVTADLANKAEAAGRSRDETEIRRAPFLRTVASEYEEMFGRTARQVPAVTSLGDLPTVVIASGRPNPLFGAEAEAFQKYWIEESRTLSGFSARGEFVLAERSGHQIHQDAPELVVAAIRKLVAVGD